jgi:hypothetical protein
MRNPEKCPECLQRFHVEWQGKSSQKGMSLILNRLIPRYVVKIICMYVIRFSSGSCFPLKTVLDIHMYLQRQVFVKLSKITSGELSWKISTGRPKGLKLSKCQAEKSPRTELN